MDELADGWLTGTGVATATYPFYPRPGASRALIRALVDGRYRVEIGAADIGTGAWTILTQIAADALEVPFSRVELQLGDSNLPAATPAAGAMGTRPESAGAIPPWAVIRCGWHALSASQLARRSWKVRR